MKRGNFLKLIATMVVAPTLMGDVEIKPIKDESDQSTFEGDRIRVYVDDISKCRLGDLILSDMDDAACIVSINLTGKPFIDARPIVQGRYRYKSLKDFKLLKNAIGEPNYQ